MGGPVPAVYIHSDKHLGKILDNLASFQFSGGFLKTRAEDTLSMHNNCTLNTQSYYLINQEINLSSGMQLST